MFKLPTPFPGDLAASSLNITRGIAYSGLVFHIWEWALGLSFETNQIWTKGSTSIVKWQYLWSRYLGFAGQIGNVVATGYFRSSHVEPRRTCMGWYIEQVIVSQVLLFSLEVSLIRRLYALFNSNSRLNFALYALVFVEHIVYTTSSIMAFRRVKILEACLFEEPLIELSAITGVVVVTQSVLWGMTIRSGSKRRAPLMSLIMRDGSWVFALVSVAILGGTLALFAPTDRPVVNPFSALIAVLVSTNCRMIINLETMPQPQKDATSRIEFTTHIDIREPSLEAPYNPH